MRDVHAKHLKSLLHLLSKSKVAPMDENNTILSKFEKLLGQPISTRTISYDFEFNFHNEQTLDITKLARRWRQESINNNRARPELLLVIAEYKHSSFFQSLSPSEEQMQCFQPAQVTLILVSFKCDSNKNSHNEVLRPKRDQSHSVHNPSPSENLESLSQVVKSRFERSLRLRSKICQKESMWVDFQDLGWSDWIIAPRTFQAYRCVGECPYPISGRLNSTNYAMLASMMNSVEPNYSPTPCCVPTSLGAVSVLYLDKSDNVVLRNYEGMIVEGCGCR